MNFRLVLRVNNINGMNSAIDFSVAFNSWDCKDRSEIQNFENRFFYSTINECVFVNFDFLFILMRMAGNSIITNELLQKVLRDYEKDDSIRVVNLLVESASGKGDNYTSEILRVHVEFSRKSGNKEIIEKRSLIVKIAHTSNDVFKELVEEYGIVDSEIKMMMSTLIEMEKFLGDTKLAARCLFGQENPPIMIIEDLKTLGYEMANRQSGLDLEHSLVAIRGLAKFHASSVALCEKNPGIKKLYNKGIFFEGDGAKLIRTFLQGSLKSLAESIANWPEIGKNYTDKFLKMSNGVFYDEMTEKTACDEKEFNVVNHGDFWVNNMMFSYDKNGKVKDHIFMDFQLPVYKSPAIDLNYFFGASLAEEVLINHRDQLINEYSNTLTQTMKRIGCKTTPPTLEELNKLILKYELYEVYSACVCLPIMTAEKNDVKSIDEMMGKDGEFDSIGMSNPLFQNRLTRRLKIWNEKGLLDF